MEEGTLPMEGVEAVTESNSGRKKRASDGDTEAGGMRVRLPVGLAIRVRETLAELRKRGGFVSAEDLLADYFAKLGDTYFEEQLVRRTPEEYYLDIASKDPEIRERLIRQAKKALSRREAPPREQKRRTKHSEEGNAGLAKAETGVADAAN